MDDGKEGVEEAFMTVSMTLGDMKEDVGYFIQHFKNICIWTDGTDYYIEDDRDGIYLTIGYKGELDKVLLFSYYKMIKQLQEYGDNIYLKKEDEHTS